MRILVTLPPYPKRETPGELQLYSDTGTLLHSCPCLGKSDAMAAQKHNNPTRSTILPFGDTPTGAYACAYTNVTSFPGETKAQFLHSYGPNGIVSMVGVAGDALIAYRSCPGKPARSGIDIHGGDPLPGTVTGLRVTDGCIRVSNPDMQRLVTYFLQNRGHALTCDVEEK